MPRASPGRDASAKATSGQPQEGGSLGRVPSVNSRSAAAKPTRKAARQQSASGDFNGRVADYGCEACRMV